MRARQAVLLTPSVSLRLVFSRSSKPTAHESSQIPFFVFRRLRTLPSSVSRKSCVCRSYINCRVCTNNSHFGSRRVLPIEIRHSPNNSNPFFSISCALFCTHQNLNPFVFNYFRTLCQKPPGVGGGGTYLRPP